MATQKLPPGSDRTQRLDAGDPQRTQRIDPEQQRTQRLDAPPADKPRAEGDRTMKIPKLDPGFRPEATQKFEASPTTTQKIDPSPTTTQKIDPPPARPSASTRMAWGPSRPSAWTTPSGA